MAIDSDGFVAKEALRTCVVLGGRGFVGRSLVLRLLRLGKWIVRVADSSPSLQLDPSEHESPLSDAISDGRAFFVQADVRHKPQIVNVVMGSSVVFYTDDTALCTDDFFHSYKIVVQGAKNVVSACQDCKVKHLIYSSSADVVFDGSHDIHDGDESLPYPCKFEEMLSDLRCQAEAVVLFANDLDGLLTCAIRPSNIFGPGDSHLVQFFVNRARSGLEKFILGTGENMSDFTYVENVAHALICAEEALCCDLVSAAGKAFFISNLEPVRFWDFISLIMEGLGYQRPLIKVPAAMVMCIVLLVKWYHEKLGSTKHHHQLSATYIVQLASCCRTFNCSAAQKHIKYSPVVSMQEGIMLTVRSFAHLAKDSTFLRLSDVNNLPKVNKLLGTGKVADILLWRDEKETFAYFLVVVLLFYWFFLCGRTFISSAAKLLLLVAIILYAHDLLPSNIFGLNIQRISSSSFELSEEVVKDTSTVILCMWKRGVQIIKALAKGDDWSIFIKVCLTLYFVKMALSHCAAAVIGAGVVIPFMSFLVYEQYESEIDAAMDLFVKGIEIIKRLLLRNLPAIVKRYICSSNIVLRRRLCQG